MNAILGADQAASPGFEPPPYPYDRLRDVIAVANEHEGGAVNLSVGAPCDPPSPEVLAALAKPGTQSGYPPSIGTAEFRSAAAGWLNRTVGINLTSDDVRATVGSKEFVAGLPHWLKLRRPDKDTVLFPAVSYPSYAMGATLAGCRAVPVPVAADWSIDLAAIDPRDIERALCLWVNTPANPTGALDDLSAAAAWGRGHDVLVVSDECYIEFTWAGRPRSILTDGSDGVLAVHSLSKRSNLAGVRSGFYAGDPDWLEYLGEVRKHAGFMPPGPNQAAAVVAFEDTKAVEDQRRRYLQRMRKLLEPLQTHGGEVTMPDGGFYLWVKAPDNDAWGFAHTLAKTAGIVVSPGEFYGDAGKPYVRIAVVQPDEVLDRAIQRLV